MKKYFITGFVILLPLILTVLIFVFAINFLTQPFIDLVIKIVSKTNINHLPPYIIKYGSQIAILIILFVLTLFLGFLAHNFIFRSLIQGCEKIVKSIPFVNKVYKTSQDIIKNLFIKEKSSFKQVVLVPFPNEDLYSIGFISREAPNSCSDALQKDLVSVLIPATPNPTTGFMVLFEKKDLLYLDMKPEDAIKFVVSCGVIIPKKNEVKIS
ncbi:MAG: DUF502 domain-containing protein [Parachlamydiales bacterium]|jgi:uncharacterized membrane protein